MTKYMPILRLRTYDYFVKRVCIGTFYVVPSCTFSVSRKCQSTSSVEMCKWDEPKGYETCLSVYNPLTKTKSKLMLQYSNVIKWYSCGPTVYDSAHIGHASCYVKLDIIRRILANVFDINVFYLMGITDIDDKIIKRSNETKTDFGSLASKFKDEFFDDLLALNVLPPTMTVKVTDNIPEIINFVQSLLEKDQAYKAQSGSVYFAVNKFPHYGKLFPPQLSDNPEKPNSEKHSPLDFTLWKAAKAGEPSWDSPWGLGRPGWHIECSAMASKILGSRLDIHSGGQDLLFPHHENEEAQSCAFHNTSQWVNYWIHTGHLLVKGDVKMSKSLKNTISISQLLASYTSNQFRMLCLLSPYRNNIEYSPDTMSTAIGTCRRLESFLDECQIYLSGVKKAGDIDEPAVFKCIQETKTSVRDRLADDFDTTRAMDDIMRFVSTMNSIINKPTRTLATESVVAIAAASNFVKDIMNSLGFTSTLEKGKGSNAKLLADVLDSSLEFRSSVREAALLSETSAKVRPQLLKACDLLRDSLSKAGVEIKDHASQKSTWSLKDVASPKF